MTTAPTVAQTVERVKREILADIGTAVSSRGDVMPDDISSYSELHDYVDANTYGGMCDEGFPELFRPADHPDYDDAMTEDPWMVHCNEVQDIVDEWLKAGRPATETHTCGCTVCQGITFTAPAGYVTDPTMVHNYAQMFRSPMLRKLAESRGLTLEGGE